MMGSSVKPSSESIKGFVATYSSKRVLPVPSPRTHPRQ